MTLDTRISQSGSNKIDQAKQRLACLTVQPAVCVWVWVCCTMTISSHDLIGLSAHVCFWCSNPAANINTFNMLYWSHSLLGFWGLLCSFPRIFFLLPFWSCFLGLFCFLARPFFSLILFFSFDTFLFLTLFVLYLFIAFLFVCLLFKSFFLFQRRFLHVYGK